MATVTDEKRLTSSFCYKTIFNLRRRVISDIEIKVFEIKFVTELEVYKCTPELQKNLKSSPGEF